MYVCTNGVCLYILSTSTRAHTHTHMHTHNTRAHTIFTTLPPHTHTHTQYSKPLVSPPKSPLERSSRIYQGVQVKRSTVVVHGEQLVIRKLVVAGIVSAEKTYMDCLTAMREVRCGGVEVWVGV